MKRRDFINLFGVSGIATFLPVALAACSSDEKAANTAAPTDWQEVGTVGELDKKGQLLNEKSPVGKVLVVGTSKSKDLIAVDPNCTHQGCTVEWSAKENKFICPCHGSTFAADGKVLEEPAASPLKRFAAKIEKGSVFVKQA